MKSFTDIEQSKMLVAILPLESADMGYWKRSYRQNDYAITANHTKELQEGFEAKCIEYIPCWSLTALADILRKEFEVCIIGYEKAWKCHITNRKNLVTDWFLADNPIDCCYGMILKLHEQKLL